MKLTAEKMTVLTDPESVTTKSGVAMVKVQLGRDKFKKNGGKWEKVGSEAYNFTAFKDVANSLLMVSAGEVLNIEGSVNQRTYDTQYRKGNVTNEFILEKFEIAND